ncbi:MAG TPA: hypothetical protein VFY87_31130 [Geminicoccaceae bacterium]|nr:hypothetical protein [Geminicoccaceae bacterium]
MPAPAQAEGRDMVRDDPVGEGTAAERPSGAAPSAAMAEFEELLRRAIAAPPRTYSEVKLAKSRRRGRVAEAGGRRR